MVHLQEEMLSKDIPQSAQTCRTGAPICLRCAKSFTRKSHLCDHREKVHLEVSPVDVLKLLMIYFQSINNRLV